jgi:phosphatidylserine decarboxylase
MQRYNLAREGMKPIVILVIIYILSFALAFYFRALAYNGLAVSLIVLMVLMFVSYFFREPDRRPVFQKCTVVAPGQGKIVSVEKRMEDEFLHQEMLCVSTFLSVFDVHVNYSPMDGVVEKVLYKKGQFINAMKSEASGQNERMSMLLSTDSGKIVVRQIAGLIARRVVCGCREGDRLKKGQRYGIIKFGSRVDLFLPLGFEIKVHPGDRVTAGLTEVALSSEQTSKKI